jgi:hypothetical protein
LRPLNAASSTDPDRRRLRSRCTRSCTCPAYYQRR